MRIPLPKMMRHWREREFEKHLSPPAHRRNLKLWAWLAKRPSLYRIGTRLAARGLSAMGGTKRRTGWLPLAGAWTKHRDMPTPQGGTFMAHGRAAPCRQSGQRRRPMSKSFILDKVQSQTKPQVGEEKRRAAVNERMERPPRHPPEGPATRMKEINRFIAQVEASRPASSR